MIKPPGTAQRTSSQMADLYRRMARWLPLVILLVAVALALTGCPGGGGGPDY
jgi:hypothetical protein